jgi:signal transduction histidine kinase
MNGIVAGLAPPWRLQLGRPGYSVRLRLTLFYTALFLVSGIALLALTYVLVAHRYHGGLFARTIHNELTSGHGEPGTPQTVRSVGLGGLIIESSIALAIMAVVCLWLGWLVAGRVLRPVRTITDTVRTMSASDLNRRLALEGPNDELRRLGETFDALLERLETAFESQRRFIAHASHELRTPLTVQRALVQVTLDDPDSDTAALREMGDAVLAAGRRQERLIDALLTLSRSQAGLDHTERVDLAALTRVALDELDQDEITIEAELEPATTDGDPELLARLITNLLRNAICHNHGGGHVCVATATAPGEATLTVNNTGPLIAADQLPRLFEPFQRLANRPTETDKGLGLGLPIIAAIAAAHGAPLAARPGPDGGLQVEVSFRDRDVGFFVGSGEAPG